MVNSFAILLQCFFPGDDYCCSVGFWVVVVELPLPPREDNVETLLDGEHPRTDHTRAMVHMFVTAMAVADADADAAVDDYVGTPWWPCLASSSR